MSDTAMFNACNVINAFRCVAAVASDRVKLR
jgi:hypothetical protein